MDSAHLTPTDAGQLEPPHLYSVRQILVATFLGTPLAGCWLMARNFERLGMPAQARTTRIAGFLSTAALLVAAFLIAPHFTKYLPVFYTSMMHTVVRQQQGAQLDARAAMVGLRSPSYFGVIGIAVASLAFYFAAAYAVELLRPADKIAVSADHDVYYGDGATAEEARTLGAYLTAVGYFHAGSTSDAILGHTGPAYTVSIIMQAGKWDDKDMISAAERLRGFIQKRKLYGDSPIELRMADDQRVVKRTFR